METAGVTTPHRIAAPLEVVAAYLGILLEQCSEHIRRGSQLNGIRLHKHPIMMHLASLSTVVIRAPRAVVRRPCPAHCDVGNCIVLHGRPKAKHGSSGTGSHLVAGALAGIVSRTATAPLETVRLCSMTGTLSPSSPNLLHLLITMARRDGWRALFRGNAANVFKAAPQKAIDFFAFEAFKASPWLQQWSSSPAATLAAAGLAGATSATILYPLEVLRSRITCDPAFAGASVAGAARAVVAAEGARALYRGWLPAVAAIVPEAAIVYGCFDLLKTSYARLTGQEEAGMAASLVFGVTSSFLGQLVSYPLETVSRRMQLATGNAVLLQCAHRLWVTEGVRGFYRGLPAATARTVPMVCRAYLCQALANSTAQAVLSFGTYEVVRRCLEAPQPCAVQQSLSRHCKEL